MANAFTNQTSHGTVEFFDNQNPPQHANVDGVPVWASSDGTVLAVTASTNGMSFDVDTVGPGTARLSVTVDVDTGTGINTKNFVSENVVVTQNPNAQAATATFTFGAFTDKTPGVPIP